MRPREFLAAAAFAGISLVVSACAPEPATIELNFPSEEAFLRSRFARLVAYETDPTDQNACARLVEDLRLNNARTAPVLDSSATDVCAFRNGGIEFDELPRGPLAFAAIVTDPANTVLMTGCVVKDVYAGDDARVVVRLIFTDDFFRLFPPGAPPPACKSMDTKCSQSC